MYESDIALLKHPERPQRLAAAERLGRALATGALPRQVSEEVNCHVHTCYSFSPYTPSLAVWKAIEAGLGAVGIIDHDAVSGCEEMLEAGRLLGIAVTAGCEIRVSFAGTALAGRKFNNPDSQDIAYIAIHGIPRSAFDQTKAFLAPLVAARNVRNRAMLERLNQLLQGTGIPALDFERDVWAISCADEQGSITERHLLSALAHQIQNCYPKAEDALTFLREGLAVEPPPHLASLLSDPENIHAHYDLLGVLKSSFLERIFIQPTREECLPVEQAIAFAKEIAAIPVYAYLGDVQESPTGDKKAERFEDAFLDSLLQEVKQLGFCGVTYMPPRNTRAQLQRVQELCRSLDLFEISGVDINSSRQSFTCPIILDPQFQHLLDATWALFAHERLAHYDRRFSLFSSKNPLASYPLSQRIARYAAIGRSIDPWKPDQVHHLLPS